MDIRDDANETPETFEEVSVYGALSLPTLEGLQPPLTRFRSLKRLTIHGVDLKSVNGIASAPPSLEELNLSGNRLREVGELPPLPNLQTLDLSANLLVAAPRCSALVRLSKLFLGALIVQFIAVASSFLMHIWRERLLCSLAQRTT